MSWKTNVLVGTAVLGMAVGVNDMLAVRTADDYQKYRQRQIVHQGSDTVDLENERQRAKLPGGIDSENMRNLTPSELRPADPGLPRFRIRP